MNLPDKFQRRGVDRHGCFPHPRVAPADEHHVPSFHAVGADLRRQFRGMLVDVPVRREYELPVPEDDGGASVAARFEGGIPLLHTLLNHFCFSFQQQRDLVRPYGGIGVVDLHEREAQGPEEVASQGGDDHPPGGDVHQPHPLQFPEDEAGVALAEANGVDDLAPARPLPGAEMPLQDLQDVHGVCVAVGLGAGRGIEDAEHGDGGG